MTDHPSTWGQWWALVWELPQAYSQGSEFWYLVTGGVDPTTGAALETGVRPALARLALVRWPRPVPSPRTTHWCTHPSFEPVKTQFLPTQMPATLFSCAS